MFSQCNENAHKSWKPRIGKYKVSDKKQENLNEVTNRWNNFRIKDAGKYPDTWFNELFDLNLKLKNIEGNIINMKTI